MNPMSVRAKAAIACSFLLMSAAALVLGHGAPTAPPPAFPPQTISLPTFTSNATVAGTNYTYTLLGGDPAKGGTTTIPTVLVAITLTIEAPNGRGWQEGRSGCRADCDTGDSLADLR